MASISNKASGHREIQFAGPDGKRKTLRLGKMTRKRADTVKLHVEDILACQRSGTSPRAATSDWVAGLPDDLRKRVEKVGLIGSQKRRAMPTLAEWLDTYIAGRTDVKANTHRNYMQAQNDMVGFFGNEVLLGGVTSGDAEDFRVHLKTTRALGEGTVRRRCKRARQFFAAAINRKLIDENPFAAIQCGHYAEDRFHFIGPEDAQQVLDVCPDVQWRLIFALARFGGLRVPSEIFPLKWGHIDWDRMRFTVPSPKTVHHGKASRIVPIFPELYPHLRDAFEGAEEGSEYVITRYRSTSQNLRTQLTRIVTKAGLEMWPKVFVNLRSSRETELAETFPLHVVTAWLGNSPDVAKRHYLQVTNEHFERATAGDESPPKKALHFPTQHPAARGRTEWSAAETDQPKTAFLPPKRSNATPCKEDAALGIPPRGGQRGVGVTVTTQRKSTGSTPRLNREMKIVSKRAPIIPKTAMMASFP